MPSFVSPRFPPRWRRRWRAWMRRSSFAWWAAAAALALMTALVVRTSLERASALTASLGSMRSVPVVVRPVDVGAVVEGSAVRMERRPSSMVPDEQVTRGVGRVALVPLVPGEVLLASKLAPTGLRGVAALLPSGMRALAVPAGPAGRPPASVGNRVDVLATFASADASAADAGAAPTVVVTAGALVLDVDDESDVVTIAVPADDAPAVAYALTAATITLALTGP